ncbi:hypothetical protein XENORESO_001087 [Xenotaenia resolanae]|uniref:Uncharacterized protein n=1 Tax=Xenotaenia resolanae TaxID=208358 RepID=A0ABV0VVJ9_9TELE
MKTTLGQTQRRDTQATPPHSPREKGNKETLKHKTLVQNMVLNMCFENLLFSWVKFIQYLNDLAWPDYGSTAASLTINLLTTHFTMSQHKDIGTQNMQSV